MILDYNVYEHQRGRLALVGRSIRVPLNCGNALEVIGFVRNFSGIKHPILAALDPSGREMDLAHLAAKET